MLGKLGARNGHMARAPFSLAENKTGRCCCEKVEKDGWPRSPVMVHGRGRRDLVGYCPNSDRPTFALLLCLREGAARQPPNELMHSGSTIFTFWVVRYIHLLVGV